MQALVEDEYGKVRCPVCGTEYDDSVIACPKCGSMSLEKREEALVKKEGRPISLPPPVQRPPPVIGGPVPPPPPIDNGPVYAQPGYSQQYVAPAPFLMRQGAPGYGYRPGQPRMNPAALGLGMAGMMLGMGGMMLGIMGTALGYSVCGFIGIFLCIIAIVLGGALMKMDMKMGAISIVMGVMGLLVTLLMVGIFWWADSIH